MKQTEQIITDMLRSRIIQELHRFNVTFPLSRCTSANRKTFVRSSNSAPSNFPHFKEKPPSLNITKVDHLRATRTSSSSRSLSNLNDAFSETNKARLVQQLGLMKPRKSLLATCSAEAAVFVPLCIVDSTPSVLFTLRSSQLNSHRGEVSFPGGKKDKEDNSLVETAIREMGEELGLERSCVHVWASLPAIPDRLGKTAITAVVGFIGEIDVNSLSLNPEEVESVFTLSLEHLCNPVNYGYTKFTSQSILPVFRNGPHKVWGLTAILLEQILLVLVPHNYKKQLFRSTGSKASSFAKATV